MTKSQKQEGREGGKESGSIGGGRKEEGKDVARFRKLKAHDLELAGERRPSC